MKYIGPEYHAGIILPNGESVRPADWDNATAQHYIKLYPFIAEWFTPSAKATDTNSSQSKS